jgi:hypothetical protein
MAMKVGQAWCDKGFHFTAIGHDPSPNRPYEEAKTPVSIADDDPNGFYAELGIEALGKTG